nr:hypothetical protein [Tanacetum cinerariifolium]
MCQQVRWEDDKSMLEEREQLVDFETDIMLTPEKSYDIEVVVDLYLKVSWNVVHEYGVKGPWDDQCVVDVAERIWSCIK